MNLRSHFPLTLVLILLAGCAPPSPDDDARPNLLLLVTDDQRFDMLGITNPLLETPEMDRLAREGVRFRNAFVTTSICAASRASILTGVVERTHGYTFGRPPVERRWTEQSYAAVLRRAGYRTGFVGKWGIRTEVEADSLFDVFVPLSPNPYVKTLADGTTRHLTDITADTAIAFLRSGPPDRPFVLSVNFNAPHAEDGDARQYIWPSAVDSLYRDIVVPAPPLSDPAFHESLPAFMRDPETSMNRYRWFWRFDTPEKAQRMTLGYYRMLTGVDRAIGRIRAELERLGLDGNTVVMLIGDNGYFLGERGFAGKWLPHEPSVRVPLIVFDPRAESPARDPVPGAMALNIDVGPTLVDLAGLPVPATMQGRSLRPFLHGERPSDWRTDFFVEHLMDHPQIVKHEGVRGERYKYARYFELTPPYEELYDLQSDPLETRNLVGDPAHADLLDSLRARTDELRDRYGGPYGEPGGG